MTDDELRVKQIREGWVTNYPHPKFTGDKLACLLSIEHAQKDICFLLDRYDTLLADGEAKQKRIEELEAKVKELKGDSDMIVLLLEEYGKPFMELTAKLEEHPEDYDRPCVCKLCRSDGD